MNRSVIPQVYTIIAFGASMLLWPFVSSVALMPSMEGTPLYLIHPFFTAELFLMLFTVIVWVVAMLISLHDLRKRRVAFVKSLVQNWFTVSLALATVVVATSGCKFYSEPSILNGIMMI